MNTLIVCLVVLALIIGFTVIIAGALMLTSIIVAFCMGQVIQRLRFKTEFMLFIANRYRSKERPAH